MAVYKFKVTIDEDENVTRDIEVRSNQGFSTFHAAIIQHFKFRPAQTAEYYASDQQWYEGDLIITLESGSNDTKGLADFIYDPHQRFICVTESYNEVALAIELIKVSKELDGVDYPRCVSKEGDPPYYTQAPIAHIADEEDEPDMVDTLLSRGDEPSDNDLLAAGAEAEQVDVKMPDMSELFKAMAEDDKPDSGETKSSKEEGTKEEKSDGSHTEFNMDDLI